MAAPTGERPRSRRAVACLCAAALLAGCGGSHHHAASAAAKAKPKPPAKSPASGTTTPKKSAVHAASPKAVKIVRAWIDSLRAGHVEKASTYFSLPLLVQNASDPLTLTTRDQVQAFNASLPCGARFVRAIADGGPYTVVTFKLTERRNSPAPCGAGVGHLAATAFAFRHGRISQWIRVTVPPAKGGGGKPKKSGPAA